jgi:hypothetical protein
MLADLSECLSTLQNLIPTLDKLRGLVIYAILKETQLLDLLSNLLSLGGV